MLSYEFATRTWPNPFNRTSTLAIPFGNTEQVSLHSSARPRWKTYTAENYHHWYTYAYKAHRSGNFPLPRPIASGVEALFEQHGYSSNHSLSWLERRRLKSEGLDLVVVQGYVKAASWVTALVRGSGTFEVTVKVPRPLDHPPFFRRQSSRNKRTQLETRLRSSDSLSMKWYAGPHPRYESSRRPLSADLSVSDESYDEKLDEKRQHRSFEVVSSISSEALFLRTASVPFSIPFIGAHVRTRP